jgi:hypothetical protein
MSMPGYAAEASLQKTGLLYRGRNSAMHPSAGNVVVPQQCASICGSDPDCMDTCIDWVTSGAPFRRGGGGGGAGLSGAQCMSAVRNCLRYCRTLPKEQRPDCFNNCTDIC